VCEPAAPDLDENPYVRPVRGDGIWVRRQSLCLERSRHDAPEDMGGRLPLVTEVGVGAGPVRGPRA